MTGDFTGLKVNSFVKDLPGAGRTRDGTCSLQWPRSPLYFGSQRRARAGPRSHVQPSPRAPRRFACWPELQEALLGPQTRTLLTARAHTSLCWLQSFPGSNVGKLGGMTFPAPSAPLLHLPPQARWALSTVYTAFFIPQNHVTGLFDHLVVKRVSFVVTLFGLKYFKVTSLSLKSPYLENGADGIVLEVADMMQVRWTLPVDNGIRYLSQGSPTVPARCRDFT